jgi:hypothetical protein
MVGSGPLTAGRPLRASHRSSWALESSMKYDWIRLAAFALCLGSGTAVADVIDRHDLEEARQHIVSTIGELERARAANHYDMQGHGLKAEQDLRDAQHELELAINASGGPVMSCDAFAGHWRRQDGALFDIRVTPDCVANVELPGATFEQSMRAPIVGNQIVGGMTRRDRRNGCTVTLHVRLVLLGARMQGSIEGVDGQCDIGPSYREAPRWIDRL